MIPAYQINTPINTPRSQYLQNTKVASLLNTQGTNWDVEVIEDIFEIAHMEQILMILISSNNYEDKLIWCGEEKSHYL